MGEERRQILEMLAEGKISPDEAERLISALEAQEQPVGGEARARPKYLRVLVDSRDVHEPTRVNVRVPISLLRAGVRLAALVPPQALDRASMEIRRSGLQIDLARLTVEDLDELIENLGEVDIDVNDAETKVRVFAE